MSVNFVSLNEVKKPEPHAKEKPKATKAAGKGLRGYLKNRSKLRVSSRLLREYSWRRIVKALVEPVRHWAYRYKVSVRSV